MNFERWHDGVGIDVSGAADMTAAERQSAFDLLRSQKQTWRETEALIVLAEHGVSRVDEWLISLRQVLDDPYQSEDDRLIALTALHRVKAIDDFEQRLAGQIRKLTDVGAALTRALLLAEEYPTDAVRQALLWATWNRTSCAPFCAGMVCYLTKITDEPFDLARRDLFLRFDRQTSYLDRKEAFAELCELVGMKFQPEQGD